MMIRYWNPAKEAESLSKQLDHLFDSFVGATPSSMVTWSPSIELIDQGETLVLTSYLSGVMAEDLDIQVTRESISITGQRKRSEVVEGSRTLYSDIRYGQFRRYIELPVAIQNNHVDASFENGLLKLVLPKVEEEKQKLLEEEARKTEERQQRLLEEVRKAEEEKQRLLEEEQAKLQMKNNGEKDFQ